MNSTSFLCLLFFYFCLPNTDGIVQKDCLRFLQLNFSFSYVDKYPEYYVDDYSSITLAQAGVYEGVQEITEYVQFALYTSPYFFSQVSITQLPITFGIDNATQECLILFQAASTYVLEPVYGDYVIDLATVVYMRYDPIRHKIGTQYVYYDTPFLHWYFDILASEPTWKYVCDIMENSCPEVWAYNELQSQDECIATLSQLPVAKQPHAHIDENNQGCRIMHATFAAINTDHCAHLSFRPMQDPHNKTKCQVSQELPSGYGFEAFHLSNFDFFKLGIGIDPTQGYRLHDPVSGASAPIVLYFASFVCIFLHFL